MTRLTLGFCTLCLSALPLAAEEWTALDTAAITALLTDQTYHYDTAKQHFYASGRTLYDAGRPSWGYWRAEADRYCSQWPPSDGWACYRVDQKGDRIRFVAGDGSATEGWPAE